VAALAYVLLPITGLVAFLGGTTPRIRFHGLQAIVFGAVWPVLLYAATWTSPLVTQLVGAAGLLLWVVLIIATALGRDLQMPFLGARLRTAAITSATTDVDSTTQ
jgi:uncharacterized membrane protein